MKTFELRDPIHKRIVFDEFERTVIDHPFFQRLRFISQLSFGTSYVYPGGVHDRFSHSLGAMHVAGRLMDHLLQDADVLKGRLTHETEQGLRQRMRLGGLLHDIGHGPFSHASEHVFPHVELLPFDWSWWKETPIRKATHEDYSVLLIQTLCKEGVLESELAQDICSLIHDEVLPSRFFDLLEQNAPGIHSLLKSVISGEVDCDRMDYLLRDSYYCGVAYGQYDLDWLISSLHVAERDHRLLLVVSENGVRAFEDMLLARYHMIDQVYFHKTKAGFSYYLEQAFAQWEIALEIPVNPYAYVQLRDARVIEMLFEAAESPAHYWAHHLMHRLPPKRILRLHEGNEEDVQTLRTLLKLCTDHQIRYFTYSAKNQLSHFGEGEESVAELFVAKRTMTGVDYVPILRYSDLLQKYNEKLQFTDFFILREDVGKYEQAISSLI